MCAYCELARRAKEGDYLSDDEVIEIAAVHYETIRGEGSWAEDRAWMLWQSRIFGHMEQAFYAPAAIAARAEDQARSKIAAEAEDQA